MSSDEAMSFTQKEIDLGNKAAEAGSWFKILTEQEKEILNYIDGFFAMDGGCVSSGIKHDTKRAEIRAMRHNDILRFTIIINALAEIYSTPPYSAECVEGFLRWVSEEYEWDW